MYINRNEYFSIKNFDIILNILQMIVFIKEHDI